MKKINIKEKKVTRGIKGIILAMIMAMSGIVSPTTTYASVKEYDRWDVDVIYSEEVKNAYAMIDADATFEINVNWWAVGHWVDSKGTSKIKWSTPTGYKGSLKKNSHKIEVKISGLIPNISLSDVSSISESGSKATFRSNTKSWSYHIYSECTSLIGYSENHYGDVVIKDSNGKKKETISVLATLKYNNK